MDSPVTRLLEWVSQRPLSVFVSTVFALFGYTNIFLFGFLLNMPLALRPFLDTYFFSTLVLEFFVSLALAAVLSRTLLLVIRFALISAKVEPSKVLPQVVSSAKQIFSIDELIDDLDKQARVNVKLVARWVRRKRLIVTFLMGLVFFAFLFVDYQSLWFLPLCVVSAPLIWMVVSRVELRRYFATPKNTRTMTAPRVYKAYAGFALVYIAACVFFAGFAKFAEKLDTSVSVDVNGTEKISILLGVTSTGVIVGDSGGFTTKPLPHFSVSAHFLPYSSFRSIGQRH